MTRRFRDVLTLSFFYTKMLYHTKNTQMSPHTYVGHNYVGHGILLKATLP